MENPMNEYLRLLAGHVHVLLLWTIAREVHGTSLDKLTTAQDKEVQNLAYQQVRYFTSALTPELVKEMCTPMPPEALAPISGKVN